MSGFFIRMFPIGLSFHDVDRTSMVEIDSLTNTAIEVICQLSDTSVVEIYSLTNTEMVRIYDLSDTVHQWVGIDILSDTA